MARQIWFCIPVVHRRIELAVGRSLFNKKKPHRCIWNSLGSSRPQIWPARGLLLWPAAAVRQGSVCHRSDTEPCGRHRWALCRRSSLWWWRPVGRPRTAANIHTHTHTLDFYCVNVVKLFLLNLTPPPTLDTWCSWWHHQGFCRKSGRTLSMPLKNKMKYCLIIMMYKGDDVSQSVSTLLSMFSSYKQEVAEVAHEHFRWPCNPHNQ